MMVKFLLESVTFIQLFKLPKCRHSEAVSVTFKRIPLKHFVSVRSISKLCLSEVCEAIMLLDPNLQDLSSLIKLNGDLSIRTVLQYFSYGCQSLIKVKMMELKRESCQ